MQIDPNSGGTELPVPFFITLPKAAKEYQRKLWRGPGLAILCERFGPNKWGDHSHEVLQVLLVITRSKFEFSYELDGGKWQRDSHIGPTAIVVPAFQQHAMVLPDGGDLVTVFLIPELVKQVLRDDALTLQLVGLAQIGAEDHVILRLVEALKPYFDEIMPPNDAYIPSIGNMLGTHVLRALFQKETFPTTKAGLPEELAHKVRAWIEGHLDEPYDPKRIAKITPYSTNHFQLLFKRSFRKQLRWYFRSRQVDLAEALLLTTDDNILDIAVRLGFGSAGPLVVWFKRIKGYPPGQIRRPGHSS